MHNAGPGEPLLYITLIGGGHVLGAAGAANICEAVWHLRGDAGARQVEGAKVGLAHVIGLGSACPIHILPRWGARLG